MSTLTRHVTAALRRTWRPLALAIAIIVALAVTLAIAIAQPAAPPPLGGPIAVERPLEGSQSRPTPSGRPACDRERSRARPSASRDGHPGAREPHAGACSGSRPSASPPSPRSGALPVPSPTVPAAGDERDDEVELDDDEDGQPDEDDGGDD